MRGEFQKTNFKLSVRKIQLTSSISAFEHNPFVDAPNILLLTATITPPSGVISLARSDPSIRLDDYANALKFYLPLVGQCVDYIVFSDNSNSDVSSLQGLVNQAGVQEYVEFIIFDGLDYPPSYGRGYGEFKLVEHVMTHSEIINRHQGSTVWKITGAAILSKTFAVLLLASHQILMFIAIVEMYHVAGRIPI